MSASFDWDFTEESAAHGRPEGGLPPDRRQRWLRRAVRAFILLVLIGLPVGLWVTNRLKVAEKGEAELRAAVELEFKTIADEDVELFRSRQDPTDPSWQQRQVGRYFSADAAQFAPAPGLIADDRPLEVKALHFFGDTGRVEVIRWFQPLSSTGLNSYTEILPFHLTWFYRQDKDGTWYHVAAPDDYWGIPYSWHSTLLQVRATEVEAHPIDALADDLARVVLLACHWLLCPGGEQYTLNFLDTTVPQVQDDFWTLPALYLTGLPENEAASAAWSRAVKLWVVEALAQARVGDGRLTERVIYRQLVSRLQAQLGLAAASEAELTSPQLDVLSRAVRDQKQHPLWRLWQARADPDHRERTELLESEIAALLTYLEQQVGDDRLFQLLPALRVQARLGDALSDLYGLGPLEFSNGWKAFLADLTGVPVVRGPLVDTYQGPAEPLEPPPAPLTPPDPPGADIALICDDRVWLADVDGGQAIPLTASGQRFMNVHWSSDGRWLLTSWQARGSGDLGALYLLAADGSGGRLLTDDPLLSAWPIGWSPDGREALFYASRYGGAGSYPVSEVWAVEVATGAMRQLPGMPAWSPDGELLFYVTVSAQGPLGTAWLADANGENPRQIADRAWVWGADVWSPDGSKLAFFLPPDLGGSESEKEAALAVYDLARVSWISPFTAADLVQAVLFSLDDFVTDGTEPTILVDRPLDWMWFLGWSADGRYLLVWAQRIAGESFDVMPVVLAAIPAETFDVTSAERAGEVAPRVLAFGAGTFVGASWSPTDPDRLAFTWLPGDPRPEAPDAYLVDLNAGLVYSSTQSWGGIWSPDGQWLALGGQGQATIVDQEGEERFTVSVPQTSWCHEVVWNPVADLTPERN